MSEENPTPAELDALFAKMRAKDNSFTRADFDKMQEKAAEVKVAAAKAEEDNQTRTGKGTRLSVGSTRGKGSQVISFEAWDFEKPETLAESVSEFLTIRNITDEKEAVRRLMLGDNEILYKEASDPVAEFVDAAWPKEIQTVFKNVVKGYSANAGVSIEETVAMLKPGFVAGLEKQGKLVKAETVSV